MQAESCIVLSNVKYYEEFYLVVSIHFHSEVVSD